MMVLVLDEEKRGYFEAHNLEVTDAF